MKVSSILLGAALLLVPAVASADSPRDFLTKAAQGDNGEIMLGRLAQQRAENSGVRDFGGTLVSDHNEALDDVQRTARRMRISVDRSVASEARNERDRLSGLRGGAFDREFVRYMIDDHRNDIQEFRNEAREHHGPSSELAQRQLPTLQKHLDLAMSLSSQVNRSVDYQHRDYRDRNDNRDRNGNHYGR